MAILGTLLKRGIRLRESLEQEYSSPIELQKRELKKLLISASKTEFGRKYKFKEILQEFIKKGNTFYDAYKSTVPTYNYEKIYSEWWYRLLLSFLNILCKSENLSFNA